MSSTAYTIDIMLGGILGLVLFAAFQYGTNGANLGQRLNLNFVQIKAQQSAEGYYCYVTKEGDEYCLVYIGKEGD